MPVKNPDDCQQAITQGNVEKIKIILSRTKAKALNEPLFGSEYFALRYAVEYEQVEIAKMFLAHGANPNLGIDDSYWHFINPPPLYTAAEKGNVELTKALIDAGANPFHEVQGRKAKTMAKGKECTQLCREAEAAWKAREEAEEAEEEAQGAAA